ncbi:MAG: hypothetical protein SWH61_12945 [Thermodesulfobacteriota bacterium]|nr:hypothetical protein [Thermodesulfobacteriota bacterium]
MTKMKELGEDIPNNIDEWCNYAIHIGFIDTLRLPQILGYDSQYDSSLLEELWSVLHLDKRGASKPKTRELKERIGTWSHIIRRLVSGRDTSGQAGGYNRPATNFLPLYEDDKDTGRFNLLSDSHIKTTSSGHIKLTELQEYFQRYLQIPLPQKLFPSVSGTGGGDKGKSAECKGGKTDEERLDDFLIEIAPELEKFYALLKKEVGGKDCDNPEGKTKRERTMGECEIDDAYAVIEKHGDEFVNIQKSDICDRISFKTDHYPRDIQGGILREVVSRKMPQLLKNRELKIQNAQALYDRYKKCLKTLIDRPAYKCL